LVKYEINTTKITTIEQYNVVSFIDLMALALLSMFLSIGDIIAALNTMKIIIDTTACIIKNMCKNFETTIINPAA